MSDNLLTPLINSLWKVPQSLWNLTHRLPNYVEYNSNDNVYRIGSDLYIPIGVTSNNTPLNLVLDNSNHACLIAGCSGSGKSNCLHTIINGLLFYNCELHLLDYKVTELGQYASLRQTKCYEYEPEAIEIALSKILDSIREEYKQLLNEGKTCSNPYDIAKVLIVEELSIATSKSLKLLSQIACICRACNWRIICTIQRGDGTAMNNQLKALLTNRICFKQIDSNNSNLVIYSDKASSIKTVGRGYYLRDSNLIEFHAYYTTPQTIDEVIKYNAKNINNNDINKPKVKDENIKLDTEVQVDNTDWISKL